MARYSNWSEMIKFINERDDYYSFSPLDIKYHLCNHSATIHSYIRSLVLCGYLKQDDYAKYSRVKEIPSDITYTKVKKYAYSSPELRIRLLKIVDIQHRIVKRKMAERKKEKECT